IAAQFLWCAAEQWNPIQVRLLCRRGMHRVVKVAAISRKLNRTKFHFGRLKNRHAASCDDLAYPKALSAIILVLGIRHIAGIASDAGDDGFSVRGEPGELHPAKWLL